MKFRNFLFYWLPLLSYSTIIFYLSSLSQPLPEGLLLQQFSFQDKLLHVLEFAIFAFLALRLLLFYRIKQPYLYAILIAIAYGLTDEIHQLFVPGRFFSVYDILANSLGAITILFLKRSRKQTL